MFFLYNTRWIIPQWYFFNFNDMGLSKIYCVSSLQLIPIFQILKYHFFYKYVLLCDICIIDQPKNLISRFEIIYNLWSIKFSLRCLIFFHLKLNFSISTLISTYINANWSEREIWEMFGIVFSNHPNLVRLLTDYGFIGMPLRKDFPLSGYFDLFYSDSLANIFYNPVELSQDFRLFKFTNPWEYNFVSTVIGTHI